jgi:hypothetical protein
MEIVNQIETKFEQTKAKRRAAAVIEKGRPASRPVRAGRRLPLVSCAEIYFAEVDKVGFATAHRPLQIGRQETKTAG